MAETNEWWRCALPGHSWQVIETPVRPTFVICSSCGKSHRVTGDELIQVGWMGPYGIVPGGMDVEAAPFWRPIFMLKEPVDGR